MRDDKRFVCFLKYYNNDTKRLLTFARKRDLSF